MGNSEFGIGIDMRLSIQMKAPKVSSTSIHVANILYVSGRFAIATSATMKPVPTNAQIEAMENRNSFIGEYITPPFHLQTHVCRTLL